MDNGATWFRSCMCGFTRNNSIAVDQTDTVLRWKYFTSCIRIITWIKHVNSVWVF
jgi:hypothetical protein